MSGKPFVLLNLSYTHTDSTGKTSTHTRQLPVKTSRFLTLTDSVTAVAVNEYSADNNPDWYHRDVDVNKAVDLLNKRLVKDDETELTGGEILEIIGCVIARNSCLGQTGFLHDISIESLATIVNELRSRQFDKSFKFDTDYYSVEVANKYLAAISDMINTEQLSGENDLRPIDLLAVKAFDYGIGNGNTLDTSTIDGLIYMLTVEPYRVRAIYNIMDSLSHMSYNSSTLGELYGRMPAYHTLLKRMREVERKKVAVGSGPTLIVHAPKAESTKSKSPVSDKDTVDSSEYVEVAVKETVTPEAKESEASEIPVN